MSASIEDNGLVVLPCQSADMGSQRCWLGPQMMTLCNLRLYDTVAIDINMHRLYLCRVWPRLDGNGNNYIQFDGTVGVSSDGAALQPHTVVKPFTIAKTAVNKVNCSALTSLVLSVVVKSRTGVLSYRRESSEFLESHVRNILRGLTIASGHTVLCASSDIGLVYDWDRVIVHDIVPKKEAYCGTVVSNTTITVRQLYYKDKFEQNNSKPIKLGGLASEIHMLRDIIRSLRSTELDDAISRGSLDHVRGVLVNGPPGCGKKSLIRYVAAECDAFIVHVDASLHGSSPGDSERNLRAAFRRAADVSMDELCILFMEELDAICPRRQTRGSEGDSLASRMLAEMLSLLDGLRESPGRFVVVATSSRPTDVEPCLRRFGRFEKEIFVGIPGEAQRLDILKVLMPYKAIADDVSLSGLASATAGYTGADLTSLIRVSVVSALDRISDIESRLLKLKVTIKDFDSALHLVRPSIQGASDMFITNMKPVSWDDIGGLADVKQKLIQSIEWPRKYPDICRKFGLRPPRGIILYGPPGCAKTSLARAAAASCNINFLAVSSAQLYSPFFGDAEKQIDELFRQARACAPSLLFIDEIDSVIGSRSDAGCGSSGNSVQQRVLSALLTQMDGVGINSSDLQRHQSKVSDVVEPALQGSAEDAGVLVMAATNRLDMVDSALLRPGRMDHIIYIPPPDFDARAEIISVYTKTKPIERVDVMELTRRTEGFTGADLENMCNEASLFAIHTEGQDCRCVTNEHFDAVLRQLKPSVTAVHLAQYAQTKPKIS